MVKTVLIILRNTLHTSFHQKESLGSLNYVLSEYALFSVSPDSVARVYSLLLEPLSYFPAVSLDWLFCPVFFGLCSLVVHVVMFYSPHQQVLHILLPPTTISTVKYMRNFIINSSLCLNIVICHGTHVLCCNKNKIL